VYQSGSPLVSIEQRRAALLGVLSCPIVIEELLANMPDVVAGKIDFELFDQLFDPEHLSEQTVQSHFMFDADGHMAKTQAKSGMNSAVMAGRRFFSTGCYLCRGGKCKCI